MGPSTHQNTASARKTASASKKGAGGRPKKKPVDAVHVAARDTPQQLTEQLQTSGSGPEEPQPQGATAENSLNAKDAEIRRLREALLATTQANPTIPAAPEVEIIKRPKGEAGDKKKGFVLKDAMQLTGNREEEAMYAAILTTNRRNCTRANLDLEADYRHQDPAKLAQVFKLNRAAFPYLTRKRFPQDWASAELVKQYLRNQRKSTRQKKKQLATRHIDDLGDDNVDIDGAGPSGSHGQESDDNMYD